MIDPWRDPDNYTSGQLVRCLGCRITCHETHWGKWCYDCNIERIDRINERFAPFEAALKTALGEQK